MTAQRQSKRNSRFIKDWNKGLDPEVLKEKYSLFNRRSVFDLASLLRRLGHPIQKRTVYVSRRAILATMTQDRTSGVAPAIILDAQGKPTGVIMDPLTRKRKQK